MSSHTHPGHQHYEISTRKLWFGFAASAFAFALNGFTGWIISSRACFIGDGWLGPIPPAGVRWLLAGITFCLFSVAATAGIISYRNWREISNSSDLPHAEGKGAREFIALSGIFVSASLAVGIIWISFPLIFLNVCMREH